MKHITDGELILAIDGELAGVPAKSIEEHLSQCWTCRARRAEFERAVEGVVRIHKTEFFPEIPPGDGPAALLRVSMARQPLVRSTRLAWTPLAIACAAAVAGSVLALGWLSGQRASAGPLPDSRLTPGATRMISREQVCGVPAEDDGRPISQALAVRVFHDYRIAHPQPRAYEVDYLISPTLGGADDIRNLWPQPYAEGVWTSRVKDALEDHLRRLVCEGQVDLAIAQQDIAADWIAAYRKYFRTNRPLAAHALFVKDPPWE
jgi:hypothetical protein